MKRWILLCLLACLVGACKQPRHPASLDPNDKGKIKPGIGVEAVKLGAGQQDVTEALGPPESSERFGSQLYLSYYQKGLEVLLQDKRVAAITCHVTEDKWKAYPGGTADGLWVGSERSDFESTLGKTGVQSFAQALKYPALGIWIRFDAKGNTNTISVMKPES